MGFTDRSGRPSAAAVASGHRSHHNSRLVVTVDENAGGADKTDTHDHHQRLRRLGRYGSGSTYNLLGVIEPGGCGGVRLLEHEQPGLQVLGDSAYGTGDARAASPRPAAAICEALDGRNPARSQNH
jgi:hypothetical protein